VEPTTTEGEQVRSEREEFEKWVERSRCSRPNSPWDIWQAAWQAARANPVVPDGYVLVPVDPTDAMKRAGNDALAQPLENQYE